MKIYDFDTDNITQVGVSARDIRTYQPTDPSVYVWNKYDLIYSLPLTDFLEDLKEYKESQILVFRLSLSFIISIILFIFGEDAVNARRTKRKYLIWNKGG